MTIPLNHQTISWCGLSCKITSLIVGLTIVMVGVGYVMIGVGVTFRETFVETNQMPDWQGFPAMKVMNKTIDLEPFYVYDDIDWMSIKCDGILLENYGLYKHADDYFFLKHALEHPKRVKNPEHEQASTFLVGGLLNLIVRKLWDCCIDSICNKDLVHQVDRTLLNSPWYQRNSGADHIVVASHFSSKKYLESFSAIKSCNWISFEENHSFNGIMRVANTYVGRRCPPVPKTHDIAFVASMHPERKTFQDRRNVCDWLRHQDRWNVSTCGPGKQCPTLAQARMGMHIRGDTFGSNRLIDTLLSNTVPVFTAKTQYDILPSFLPWKEMSVFVPVNSEESFRAAILRNVTFSNQVSKVAAFNRKYKVSSIVDWRNNFLFELYVDHMTKRLNQREPHLPPRGQSPQNTVKHSS